MRNLIWLIFCICFFSVKGQVNFEWVKTFGGNQDDSGGSISVDESGNIYTVGAYYGIVDFDPSSSIFNLNSNPGHDIFIQKLDPSGNLLWAKSIGGIGSDGASCIKIVSNSVYIAGSFSDSVDFDSGAGTFYLSAIGNGSDPFILKIDTSGNFIWAKSFGGTVNEQVNEIDVDFNGNILITGEFTGTIDFDPGIGESNLTSFGVEDIFIQKLDSLGNFLWVKHIGNSNNEGSLSIKIDKRGNVYTTGYYKGIVDFDPGAGIYNLSSILGDGDIFVLKLDSSGQFQWAKSFGSTLFDIGYFIALDSSCNIYTLSLSSLDGKCSIHKLDSLGNLLWLRSFGSSSGSFTEGFSLAVDAFANVYSVGRFSNIVDFDPSNDVFNINSAGDDIFIQKMDSLGNFLWAKSFYGGANDNAECVVVDYYGNIYITGGFGGTIDFDPNISSFNAFSFGYLDIFVHKMSSITNVSPLTYRFLKLYPQPAQNELFVSEMPKGKKTLALQDLLGKVVWSKESLLESEVIDLSALQKGMYLLVVEAEGRRFTEKVLKE